jgi:hypothetical protein
MQPAPSDFESLPDFNAPPQLEQFLGGPSKRSGARFRSG